MIDSETTFLLLGLNANIIRALSEMGYVKPSPIQKECIPYLLKKRDILGMAQTGSGKTAAFALPLLNNIKINLKKPQILVLTPTRELAIQVSEAFISFSKYVKGIHVLALYGGQRYDLQLKSLRTGPQIIVGTPGRLLDHLKRGTLDLSYIKSLVLDEADEMLRMGFIEDVETIISKIPKERQTALFSATMPEAICRISRKYMNKPKEIKIHSNIKNRPDIQQSFWIVYGKKTEALIRFLETEEFSATIIFVRTKNSTLEVSDILEKNGYNSAALNGDMNQSLREKTLERLKNGKLDILIATDVAARGLDVDRISLVINYDIPMDAESYVHRIGRTGRAGRTGKAILFVENRERRLLRNIERIMKLNISEIQLPSSKLLESKRIKNFSEKINLYLKSSDLEKYKNLLPKIYPIKEEMNLINLSAALLKIAQGERVLIVPPDIQRRPYQDFKKKEWNNKFEKNNKNNFRKNKKNLESIDIYRIDLGKDDGIEVRHIVGAIANEGKIPSKQIGNIRLLSSYSTIELPKGISKEILNRCSRTRIFNKFIYMKLLPNFQLKNIRKFNNKNNSFRKFSDKKFLKNRRIMKKK
ncbi:DEAD/DEAH box helicase [Buchnera aphidicola (Kurisakia onigurumii)]|uniref:DEAD/DEAH box helicase n=1 Tax=Buchnera aphidicola TaxID=9 RepID=UPI0031B67B41